MLVKRSTQPFDRASEIDAIGYGRSVGAHDVDLGIELAIPPPAHCFDLWPRCRTHHAGQFERQPHHWLNSSASPG